jgi:hypothetical protein
LNDSKNNPDSFFFFFCYLRIFLADLYSHHTQLGALSEEEEAMPDGERKTII